MYKYFPDLQNGVDDADVDEIKDAFNEIENDITALQNKKETDPTVPSWAKEPQKPTYTADEVGALPSDTKIPTKISDLENDLTELQDVIADVGDLGNLSTENKDNLVNAINELYNKGIKPYIVTKLPTENIDENGIYILVKYEQDIENGSADVDEFGNIIEGPILSGEIFAPSAMFIRTNECWLRVGIEEGSILEAVKFYLGNNYYNKNEIDEQIGSGGSGEITDGSITSEKLADGAVTYSKLDDYVKSEISAAGNQAYERAEEAMAAASGALAEIDTLRTGVNINSGLISSEQAAREEADTALSSSLEWKLIGEAQITQEAIDEAGEDGITAITIDFGSGIDYTQWYGETLTEIIVPQSNNINSDFKNGLLHVSFGNTLESSLISSGGNRCPLVWTQSNANLCKPEWSQRILITSTWKRGRLSHSLIIYRAYSATPGYISTPCATESDISTINYITGKRFLSVSATGKNSAGTEVSCKYPANSILRIYGRF